jgi:hypothetical protein
MLSFPAEPAATGRAVPAGRRFAPAPLGLLESSSENGRWQGAAVFLFNPPARFAIRRLNG